MGEVYDPTIERAKLRVGSTLREKWRLDRLLGVGGMAAVYAATHRNGKRAAVKVLHPELSIDANVRGRFLREGHVANRVGHAGAVSVIDDDTADDGSAFLVMDLLDGETLADRAERGGGRLTPGEVLAAIDQLLDVLAAAHAQGIVHRDIKPENVFITRDGQIRVLDFGIARLKELSTKSTATQQGSTMGTPAFMPPEQARGLWEMVDARSDLWAVGATAFTLLSGRLVHEARTANEQLLAAMTAHPLPVSQVVPGLPTQVNEVVDRALAFDPKNRWTDARAMQAAVRVAYQSLAGSPITTAPRMEVPAAPDFDTAPTIRSTPDGSPSVTGDALVSGRTGMDGSKVKGIRKSVLVAAIAAGSGLGVAVVIAGVFALRVVSPATATSAIVEADATVPMATADSGLDAAPTAVAIDELPVVPTASSSKATPPRPGKTPPVATPPATVAAPPPTKPPDDPQDLMDKRR